MQPPFLFLHQDRNLRAAGFARVRDSSVGKKAGGSGAQGVAVTRRGMHTVEPWAGISGVEQEEPKSEL